MFAITLTRCNLILSKLSSYTNKYNFYLLDLYNLTEKKKNKINLLHHNSQYYKRNNHCVVFSVAFKPAVHNIFQINMEFQWYLGNLAYDI
jgi:hypothetical protein